MAQIPGTLPRWADVASGAIVEPSSGKKDQGFIGGEQPPAQYFNWLFNTLYQCMQYLNAPDSMIFGGDKLGTEANAVAARITVDPATEATAQYVCAAAFGGARVWVGSTTRLAIVLTYNASRTTDNSDKWQKITNSQPATAIYLARGAIRIASMPLAQNTAWTDAFVEGEGTTSGWGSLLNFNADSESETNADSDVAREVVQMPTTAGTERKLLFHFKHATLGVCRVYYSIDATNTDANGLEIVFNAGWSNSGNLWTYDLTAMAFKVLISPKRLQVKAKTSGTAGTTYADSAWTNSPINFQWLTTTADGSGDENKYDLSNGRLRFLDTQTEQLDDANPDAALSVPSNSLCAKNICKAWGIVNELTTGPVMVGTDGYNVTSMTHDTTAETITINIGTDLGNNPCITFGCTSESGSNDFLLPQILSYSSSAFTVRFLKITTGGAIALANLGTDTFDFSFQVMGQQNS